MSRGIVAIDGCNIVEIQLVDGFLLRFQALFGKSGEIGQSWQDGCLCQLVKSPARASASALWGRHNGCPDTESLVGV